MPDHVWLALKDEVLTNLATVALVHLVFAAVPASVAPSTE